MSGTRVVMAIGLALALAGAGRPAAAQDHKYVGVKKCRTCHKKELIGNQYKAWKDSPHAKALETLKGEKALKYAKEKEIQGPPSEAEDCVQCHVTAYGVEPERIKYALRQADGVQCESCHGPGNDYRKKKIMSDHDKAVAKGMWEPGKNEKICTDCHNDKSPGWDPKKYQLADGRTAGFDFEQAKEKIKHPIPKDVKGKYIEIEKQRRAEKKARAESSQDEAED